MQSKADHLGANGTLHLQVRYLPFVSPELQAEAAKKAERSRHKAIARARKTDTAVQPATEMRGVLTVTVHRCLNLEVNVGSVWCEVFKIRRIPTAPVWRQDLIAIWILLDFVPCESAVCPVMGVFICQC